MQEAVSAALMILGAFFMLFGGLGILRFPDVYMRVSASTKASTLGAGLSLLALAVHFNELGVTMRALATIVFLIITGPVAAHLISRAAYLVRIRLWQETTVDELRGRYDPETGKLEGIDPGDSVSTG